MKNNEDKIITLKIYSSVEKAEQARAKLDFGGIKSFVSTDDCGGMRPFLQLTNGVRLMVLEKDADSALKILEN